MKRITAALALAAPWFALAQGNVTVYGLVEGGMIHVDNVGGGAQTMGVTSRANGSRLGFRGTEDLGKGLQAIFALEQGFDTSKGTLLQGGRAWGRMAYVGLKGRYGTITAGRQFNATIGYLFPIAATGMWAWTGSHPGDLDNLMSGYGDNSLKYVSPKFGGFEFTGMYALGEQSGSSRRNALMSLGLQYSQGPLRAALVYEDNDNPSTTIFGGTVDRDAPNYASPVRNPVFRGYASARKQKIVGLGASYRVGAAQLGAVYTQTRLEDILRTATTPHDGNVTFKTFELNGRYSVSKSLDVGAAIDYTTTPTAKYTQIKGGPTYWFSRRTDLQVVVVHQKASGTDSTGVSAKANISPVGASNGSSQTMLKVALRTRF